MGVLESRLVIKATDETAKAFEEVQKRIASIEKAMAEVNRVMANMGNVANEANLFRGLAQQEEMTKAVANMERLIALTEKATAAQRSLAQSARAAGGALANEGRAGESAMRPLAGGGGHGGRPGKTPSKHGVVNSMSGGMVQFEGMLPLVAAIKTYEVGKKVVENAADLEQLRFRIRELSRNDPSEAPMADKLAGEVASKYPGITRAKALDTYLETRANSVDAKGRVDPEVARRNLMAMASGQNAALALGFEFTPEDGQNLLKGIEGSGRAGDPKAVDKITDAYIRAKQVFGSAIASNMIRDYVANAKTANFSIGDDQFYLANMVRMSEGNASRFGNEVNQTLATLAGGRMKKGAALGLAELGLVDKNDIMPTGGGNVRIVGKGLKDSALLQTNQMDWAAHTLRDAIEKSGAVNEDKVAARTKLMIDEEKKRNPNADIDPRFMRERAEEALIAAKINQLGLNSSVPDNLIHFIGNERLIDRDIAALQNSSGKDAGNRLAQNPVAAMTELANAVEGFGTALASPFVANAGPMLDSLARGIETLTEGLLNVEKQIGEKSHALHDLFFNGAKPGAASIDEKNLLTDPNFDWQWRRTKAKQSDDHPMISGERDMESARAGVLSRLMDGGHSAPQQVDVSVHGDANVQTTVIVTPSSELLNVYDGMKHLVTQIALNPNATGHAGRMDSDAIPLGRGGIGSR